MQTTTDNSARKQEYILDSYAILAYLEGESGSNRVRELLEAANNNDCHLSMCVINLGEVLYIIERERSLPHAQEILARIDEFPIDIVETDRSLTLAAAHIKANFPIAYADCFAAALAHMNDAILVTGDPEFRIIETDCAIRIEWLV